MSITDRYQPKARPKVDPFTTLTAREQVVLQHLQQGRIACEIAALDFVTITTVRSQIRQILYKLGVNSQLAAVALANKRTQHERCAKCEYRMVCVGAA
jgi:radical SAM protein with 4Fe4S-binding SPASM domain